MRKGAAWGKLTSRAWKVSLSPWMYKGQNASVISSLVLDNTALLKTGWLHNYRATGRRASNSTPRTYVCLVVQPSLRKSHLLKLWITDNILCQNGESLWHLLSDLASTLHTPRSSFFRDSPLNHCSPKRLPVLALWFLDFLTAISLKPVIPQVRYPRFFCYWNLLQLYLRWSLPQTWFLRKSLHWCQNTHLWLGINCLIYKKQQLGSHSTSTRIHIPSPWTQHKTQMKTGGNRTASFGFQSRFHQHCHSFSFPVPWAPQDPLSRALFPEFIPQSLRYIGHTSQSICMGICRFTPQAQRGLHHTMILFPQLQAQ